MCTTPVKILILWKTKTAVSLTFRFSFASGTVGVVFAIKLCVGRKNGRTRRPKPILLATNNYYPFMFHLHPSIVDLRALYSYVIETFSALIN
jgi:hypothetical protein